LYYLGLQAAVSVVLTCRFCSLLVTFKMSCSVSMNEIKDDDDDDNNDVTLSTHRPILMTTLQE